MDLGGACDDCGLYPPMTRCWDSDRHASDRARLRHNTPVPSCPDVAEQLRELDCDPIAGMAKLARDDTVPIALRARMFADLANYAAPRRKAVELTGAGGAPVDVEITYNFDALSPDELETLKILLEKAGIRRTNERR